MKKKNLAFWALAVIMVAVIIAGAGLIANSARGVKLLDAGGVNISPESIGAAMGEQELINLAGVKEAALDVPKLTITTPRDLFSPFMSSMFGFELVLDAPGDPAIYTYACDRGAFCTYKDAKVTHQGNNLTTAEKVYWAPLEGGEYVYSGEMDKILISVTALDKEGKAIARGTAAIEHDSEGGWFKFTGEAAANQSKNETMGPVQVIKDGSPGEIITQSS